SPYYTDVRTGKYDIGWWIDNLPAQPPIVVADLMSSAHWYVFQAKYPELDSYLEKGGSTLDQAQRKQHYSQAQKFFNDEAIGCMQFWIEQTHVTSKRVQGMSVDPLGVLRQAEQWKVSK
ncbi:MAG TPA: hypothetical protein VD902_01235, partial [Symbiobacteriaceae bacterium]|nr:hypothetical protein [Symbiobacteriaceae bacterium]